MIKSLRSMNFKKIQKNSKKSCEKGFSFVETLIAITILSIALTGVLTIVSRSVQTSIFARDQVIAFYLAQEAIEYVQNKRSSNVLGGIDWLSGFDKCLIDQPGGQPDQGPCAIWIDSSGAIQIRKSGDGCGAGMSCQPLKFDETLYNHNPPAGGNESTIFSREVTITPINYDIVIPPYDQIAVAVTINWYSNAVNRSLVIRHNILNWQQ